MPHAREVDVAILGAGTAGLNARRAAKDAGASALMIDPGPFGTTCARVGCMPSKLLIAAADAAHHARTASAFGVHVAQVEVDGAAVLERVQSERDRFVGFVVDSIERARTEGELLAGRGRVTAPGRLLVDERTEVVFESLVVATGTHAFVPPPYRGLEHLLLTNEEIFELATLPESVLVVGLGVIGLELGQALARLGVRTTLLGIGGGIGPLTDRVVLAEARRVLSSELDLHPDHELKRVEPVDEGARVHFVDSAGQERVSTFERILIAAGRHTSLPHLGLEVLGLRPSADGTWPIDTGTLQLGEAPVFVAGDASLLHPLLHEAADDGRLAGANAARFPEVRATTRRVPLAVTFSDPQIGIVGRGGRALLEAGAVAGEVDYGDQGRARVYGVHRGKVRIYAEPRDCRLVGAELFGPRVEHLAHLLAWAVQSKLTVHEALAMPFYHPVIEEGVRTALRGLAAALRRGRPAACALSTPGVS